MTTMRRMLLAGCSSLALAAQPTLAGTKTSVQWGIDRTVTPPALCVYDGANICNTVLALSPGGAIPFVASNAALRAFDPANAPSVLRAGFAAGGDAPPLTFVWNASCPGTPDNIALYVAPLSGGSGCWSAAADPNLAYVTNWGAVDVGVGNVTGVDSTAALNAALSWCGSQKNGRVNIGPIRVAATSADVTVPLGCTLHFNSHTGWRNDGSGYQFSISNTNSALLLSSGHTLNLSGTLEAPAIFAYGLAPATSFNDAYTKVNAFAGTAITVSAPDVKVSDAFVVGFGTCYSVSGWDRPWLMTAQFDCTNGMLLSNVQDVGHISHVHGLAWFLNNLNSTPYGIAFQNISAITNAGGLIGLTTDGSANFTTGQVLRVRGVGGFAGANGDWPITVVDSTHLTLTGSTYAGITVAGTWASGETSIAVASMAGIWPNMTVTGANIAANTTIASIDPFQNKIWLSKATTGAGSSATLTLANPSYTSGGIIILDTLARSGEFLRVEAGAGATFQNNFTDIFSYGWKTGAHIIDSAWTVLDDFSCDMYTDPANICVWWDGNSLGNQWIGGEAGGTGAVLLDTTNNVGDANSMIGVNVRANVGSDDYSWTVFSFSGVGSRQIIGNFTPSAGIVSRVAQYSSAGPTTISGAMPFLDIYPQNETTMASINVGDGTILAAGSPYGYQAALQWNPVLKFGANTQTTNGIGYVKIAWPWMTVKANVFMNAAVSGTGFASITGLPFPCQTAAGQDGDGGSVAYSTNMQSLTSPVVLMGRANAAAIDVTGYDSTGTTFLSHNNFTSTSGINGTVGCKMAFVQR